MIEKFSLHDHISGYLRDPVTEIAQSPATIVHRNNKVSLILIWNNNAHPVQAGWFGPDLKRADDGSDEYVLNDDELPSIPSVLHMCDGLHDYTLVGCRLDNSADQVHLFREGGKVSLTVDYVVRAVTPRPFERLNGLVSEIDLLRQWISDTGFVNQATIQYAKDRQKVDHIEIGTSVVNKRPYKVTSFRDFDIEFLNKVEVSKNRNSRIFTETTEFKTKSSQPKTWDQHIEIHKMIKELVSLSLLEGVGFIDHQAVRWDICRPINNQDLLPEKDDKRQYGVVTNLTDINSYFANLDDDPNFLFRYADIGNEGISKWFHMRSKHRGLNYFFTVIESPTMSLNDKCNSIGIALELIFTQMKADRQMPYAGSYYEMLKKISRKLSGSKHIHPSFNWTKWTKTMRDGYTGNKHGTKDKVSDSDKVWAVESSISIIQVLFYEQLISTKGVCTTFVH